MRDNDSFDRLKKDFEERQKAILWEDAMRNGTSVDEFLWKGDPNAKPIQRVGLVVFALMFFLIGILFAAFPFMKNFENGSIICFFMAFVLLFISVRMIRNALLRPTKHS